MFPGSHERTLKKEQEKLRIRALDEERQIMYQKAARFIEEDDLDSLKEIVPSKVPIDVNLKEFLLFFCIEFHHGKV